MPTDLATAFTPDSARRLPGPDWLVGRRVEAAETAAGEPMPTVDAEEWRYSRIGDLDVAAYRLAGPDDAATTVSGGEGAWVGPLGDHVDAAALLGAVVDTTPDHFTRLNDGFCAEPIVIDVPRGAVVEEPIVVHHHLAGTGVAAFPRLVVRVGENAQAAVVERFTSPAGDDAFVCPVTELDVHQAGRLGYTSVQALGDRTWQIASLAARADRDATVVAGAAAFGGEYARLRTDARLVGRGAHGDLLSMYFGEGHQTLDFRTYQDHQAPDTTSNLLYKGALAGSSRSVYTGLIRVRPDARGTNAFQTNRNLKLSEDAWAESVPNLEIENNDVKCSHASTVSPVDADQRFYLESRGVRPEAAERLIVAGFFDEVLRSLPVPSLVPELRDEIAHALDRQVIR